MNSAIVTELADAIRSAQSADDRTALRIVLASLQAALWVQERSCTHGQTKALAAAWKAHISAATAAAESLTAVPEETERGDSMWRLVAEAKRAREMTPAESDRLREERAHRPTITPMQAAVDTLERAIRTADSGYTAWLNELLGCVMQAAAAALNAHTCEREGDQAGAKAMWDLVDGTFMRRARELAATITV